MLRPGSLRPRLSYAFILFAILASVQPGCSRRFTIDWPERPIRGQATEPESGTREWAVESQQKCIYTQRFTDGRATELVFDDDADGTPEEVVSLATPPDGDVPHFMIILDGVPFDLLNEMYLEGYFRLFPRPSRLISVFPAMTDVALSRVFHTQRCLASEAQYYDRERGMLSDANDIYLSGANAPWLRCVDYHAPQSIAVRTYLQPGNVFSTELEAMYKLFSTTKKRRAIAYSVGTAGLGTRGGAPAIKAYLKQIDRLCERITYERRGRVRFSILADHGHSLQRCERITFRDHLLKAGYRVAKRLTAPKDVVIVSYGLVTCAQFYTARPRELASTLLDHEAVDLVAYADGANVVVRSSEGTAALQRLPDGFRYQPVTGDPLFLEEVLGKLEPADEGETPPLLNDRAILEATAEHRYPDPLYRLWNAFQGYVKRPADVIVSLKPRFCYGSKFFYTFVSPIESTHGALDYDSSVTFTLSNATKSTLPDVLRVEDVRDALLPDMAPSASTTSRRNPGFQH